MTSVARVQTAGSGAGIPRWGAPACRHRRRPQTQQQLAGPLQQRRHSRRAFLLRSTTDGSEAPTSSAAPASSALLDGAATMQEVYDRLADHVCSVLASRSEDAQPTYLVGIAGVPGSGKSSLAKAVCERLNARGVPAQNVPMDGFHFYRRQLDQMPDPELAHARRGAEWTFDARAYHSCLAAIKSTGEALAPSFDHGVGDPRPEDISVTRQHRVVLSEGNYVLLGAEPWWRLGELWDEAWYIDCPVEEAMQRVFQRQTGNGLAPEVSRWRVAANDRPNAEQIETSRGRASLVVPNLPLS